LEKKSPETLGQILTVIKEIPEYNVSAKQGVAPQIFVGEEKSHAGRIMVDFTGGTENSEKIVERMSQHGIGTIVTMHAKEPHRKEALKHYINFVIAGHIASDSLGLNIIMDELEKCGLEIIPCSGFIRFSRNKKRN
jgi:putative NIF3 family GTP cyclohydrolase 1 type 2